MDFIILIVIGAILAGGARVLINYFSGKRITYTNSSGEKVTENLERRKPRKFVELEKPTDFEVTPEIANILDQLENTSNNIFLTGKAGTGKSTLLKYFRVNTNKNYAVVAPTGIAAINVQGQTIHSFFGFGIDITPSRVNFVRSDKLSLIRNLQTLIIDEISMVRADLLDCIDVSLRKNRRDPRPFGGVQIIAIGDPYQLPPVVKNSELKYFNSVYDSPHFFNAKCYRTGNFQTFELTKIYRQKGDPEFIDFLNNLRIGTVTEETINFINLKTSNNISSANAIKLVTTNALVKAINTQELNRLNSKSAIYKGQIIGKFKETDVPTDIELYLKEGARVMLLNNDKNGRWVNGDIGVIISLDPTSVKVKFEDNTFDDVDLNTWDNIEFVFSEEERKIEPISVGKYVQLPIKLAWAVTIHKSQGKTYENIHIDFGTGTFAPGQAYVALSRCKSLSGISFEAPMVLSDVITDKQVKEFMGIGSETEIRQETVSGHTDISNEVLKSDLNKLYSFIESPEKYAIRTEKAISKVKHALEVYKNLERSLDDETKDRFMKAVSIYQKKLH